MLDFDYETPVTIDYMRVIKIVTVIALLAALGLGIFTGKCYVN